MKNLNKTEQRMLKQIKRAKEEGRGIYTLPMKTQNFYNKYKKSITNKIEVKADSNTANILKGKTRGYHQWYIRHILSNSSSYTIID